MKIKPWIFLLLFLLFFVRNIFSQIFVTEKILCKHLVTNQDIKVKEYQFKDQIINFSIDSLTGNIIANTRAINEEGKLLPKRSIVCIQKDSGEIRWSHIAKDRKTQFKWIENELFRWRNKDCFYLDKNTGKSKWKVEYNFLHITKDKVGIGYKTEKVKKNKLLSGINMTDGKLLWEREVSRKFGWNELLYINEDDLLISSSGLQTVDIHNGFGWVYKGKSGIEKSLGSNALYVGLALTGGLPGFGLGILIDLMPPSQVRGLVSNVVIDKTGYYYTDREHIVHLNKEGEVFWSKPLSSKLTSYSTLLLNGDKLIYVNRGFANKFNRKIKYGKPTIAVVNKNTGEELFSKILNDGEKGVVQAVSEKNNCLTVVINNVITSFHLGSGEVMYEEEIYLTEGDEITGWQEEAYLSLQKDNSYQNQTNLWPNQYHIRTKYGKVISLNKELKLVNKTLEEKPFKRLYRKGSYTVISNGEKTILLNEKGKAILELLNVEHSIIIGNKFYMMEGKRILEVDLPKIK